MDKKNGGPTYLETAEPALPRSLHKSFVAQTRGRGRPRHTGKGILAKRPSAELGSFWLKVPAGNCTDFVALCRKQATWQPVLGILRSFSGGNYWEALEGNMKRVLWIVLLLVVSPSVYADSIPIFNIPSASLLFDVNSGSGDNASLVLLGREIAIFAGGGTGCDWCLWGTSFQPGQSLNPSIPFVGIHFVSHIELAGRILDAGSTTLGSTALLAANFVFPSDPKVHVFIAAVPANFSGLLIGSSGDAFPAFGLKIPPGKLFLTFDSRDGKFFFSQGVFVAAAPEPGTLVMVGSGLFALGTLVYKRHYWSVASTSRQVGKGCEKTGRRAT